MRRAGGERVASTVGRPPRWTPFGLGITKPPVVSDEHEDGILIALPYGERTDWMKNVLARGTATVVTHGQEYEVDQPQVIPRPRDTVLRSEGAEATTGDFGVDRRPQGPIAVAP